MKRAWSLRLMDFPNISMFLIIQTMCLVILILLFRFRNAVIEITSLDVGVFEVRGRVLGVSLDKFELVFQVRHDMKCTITPLNDLSIHFLFNS